MGTLLLIQLQALFRFHQPLHELPLSVSDSNPAHHTVFSLLWSVTVSQPFLVFLDLDSLEED